MNTIAYFQGPTAPIIGALTDGDVPQLERRGKAYSHLSALIEDEPGLTAPEHLHLYCRLATFLVAGAGQEPILAADAFKEAYQATLEEALTQEERTLHTAADFGPFDVSEVHEPRVEQGTLSFYVTDQALGIPYRVTAPFPLRSESDEIRYELLPASDDTPPPETQKSKVRIWLR